MIQTTDCEQSNTIQSVFMNKYDFAIYILSIYVIWFTNNKFGITMVF